MTIIDTTAPVGLDGLAPARLRQAKAAYTTRHVDLDTATHLISGPGVVPRSGDVVLATVLEIGKHTKLEGPASRRAALHIGDEIVVAYGNRYAPDQFEAYVPAGLGPTHLVAAGGLAADVLHQHADMIDATRIQPLGLLHDGADVINVRASAAHAIRPFGALGEPTAERRPRVIAVVGTSMNSGKSTTLAKLTSGLSQAGLHVAAGKATGTGAGGDRWMFADAGAHRVLDFTDFGHPSTFLLPHQEVKDVLGSLVSVLAGFTDPADATHTPDIVLVEIADGLFQSETKALLHDPEVLDLFDAVVFASGDAVSAFGGVTLLASVGVTPLAVSGRLTASPLATREASQRLDVPVIPTFDLAEPAVARSLIDAIPTDPRDGHGR